MMIKNKISKKQENLKEAVNWFIRIRNNEEAALIVSQLYSIPVEELQEELFEYDKKYNTEYHLHESILSELRANKITKLKKMNKTKEKLVQRLFVSMDGTIVKWGLDDPIPDNKLEETFASFLPEKNALKAIKSLNIQGIYDVYILTAAKNEFIEKGKIKWLKKHFPKLADDHIIFTNGEASKSSYIVDKRKDDILLDATNKNLHEWHGIPVKFLNGREIHDLHKWKSKSVDKSESITNIFDYFVEIAISAI